MRGKPAPKRIPAPDPRYGSITIAKFINYIMLNGKKSVAQQIVYGAFDRIEEKSGKKPLDVFDQAMKNITPALEVRSRRVGGANYQVPMPVRGDRRNALAFRWLIAAAKARKGKERPDNYYIDIKYDGNRYQIHKNKDLSVIIFNRKGKIVTEQFPDIEEQILELEVDDFIIDTEIYPINIDGTPAPHKKMGKRVHKLDKEEAVRDCPVDRKSVV